MQTFTVQESPRAQPNSPPIVWETLRASRGAVLVVRDDLLTGGTKQRAVEPYLRKLAAAGFNDFVYASPFSGYAQVALAASCANLGLRCTLFCEQDQTQSQPFQYHEFTERAVDLGAHVFISTSLAISEAKALHYSEASCSRTKIPLGFDTPDFHFYLAQALTPEWHRLTAEINFVPRRVWLPMGSGTLTRVFQKILPQDIQIQCVDVHVLPKEDLRLQSVCLDSRTKYFSAPEKFCERALTKPPVPSNSFYDAKIWQFIEEQSLPGDIWWNVA